MSSVREHDYLKVCAQLASCLSISIAAAKKKVDLEAAKQGVMDLDARKEIAAQMLDAALKSSIERTTITNQLDNLLEALAEDENFMVED